MLETNRANMERVAERLLKKETITSVDMEEICGPRRGRSPKQYSDIIRSLNPEKKNGGGVEESIWFV